MPKRSDPPTTVSPVTAPKGVEPADQPMILNNQLYADLAAIKAALGIGATDQIAGSNIDHLISEFFNEGTAEHKKSSIGTLRTRLKTVSRFMGSTVAKDLTHVRCNEFIADLVTQAGVTRTTAVVYLVSLNAVLNWAVDQGKLRFNPLQGYKLTRKHANRERLFTDDEIDAFLRAALRLNARQIHAVISIMRWSGVRPNEIRLSARSSLDPRTGLLVVTEEIAKTNKERVVAILPDAMASLRQLPDSKWLIPAKDVSKPMPMSTLMAQWERVVDVSGVEWQPATKRPELYSMRHTLATRLALEHGYGAFELMAAMGWESVSMAARYVRPGAKHALEMASRIQARPVKAVGKLLPMTPDVSVSKVTYGKNK